MEVNNSSKRIKKFNWRPSTISLREFKATFSNYMVPPPPNTKSEI
jgi:hypothetical protein